MQPTIQRDMHGGYVCPFCTSELANKSNKTRHVTKGYCTIIKAKGEEDKSYQETRHSTSCTHTTVNHSLVLETYEKRLVAFHRLDLVTPPLQTLVETLQQ
jgi:hypothetical protein